MPMLSRVRSVWHTLVHKERLDRELDAELRAAAETLADRYVAEGLEPRGSEKGRGSRAWRNRPRERERAGRAPRRRPRRAHPRSSPRLAQPREGTGVHGGDRDDARARHRRQHGDLQRRLRDAARAAAVPRGHELTFIWLDRRQVGYRLGPMSGPDLRDLRERTQSFDSIGGIWATGSITLTGEGEPEQIRAAQVTTNFFQVLGVTPVLGRTFHTEDSAAGAEPTVLLGWELFERRYGADPTLVGRTIDVNGEAVRVIGVMPRSFRLLLPPDASVPDRLQAWAPFWPDLEAGPRRNLFLRVVARMKPGITVAAASDDVSRMAAVVSRELGADRAFTVAGLQDDGVRAGPRTVAGALRLCRHPPGHRLRQRGQPPHRACGFAKQGNRCSPRARGESTAIVSPGIGGGAAADHPRRSGRGSGWTSLAARASSAHA